MFYADFSVNYQPLNQQCPVYHDLRLKYLHPFNSPPTEETFQNVLATEDHCSIQGVSLYYISRIPEDRKFYIRQ